jgi:hypothetical protein
MRYLQSKSVFEHYLKRFNESHTDDVIQTVKDILLPISDMGYDISVVDYDFESRGKYKSLIIRVVTYVDKPLSITDEVKDEFMRMGDYLRSEGYNSIEAHYYTILNGKFVKELDEFINVKSFSQTMESGCAPIANLLFSAKKIL